MRRLGVALLVALAIHGCSESPTEVVDTYTVARGDFSISVIAAGELRAAESTPITPPAGSRAPRTIKWLAPDNSRIRKGDVVARFDITSAELGANSAGIEIDKVDLQVVAKHRELDRLLSELGNQLELVDIEKLMADEFTFDNELAYSRFEIIDATRDKELLDYKSSHLEGKKENYSERQSAEVAVLSAARTTQESNLEEQTALLDNHEVRAPHDGLFVIDKNWWGQRIEPGSTVFAGNKFASIPDLSEMQAILNVLETEAVGLALAQNCTVVIDAFPDREIPGSITSISATAAPIERDNPVKYFTVVVTLDQADPDWIKPGAIVTAEIWIKRIADTVAIPNQAVFQKDQQSWVLVRAGSDLARREVRLGQRGANRSQVLDGLAEGDEIALFPPESARL
jgi:multidrug efflux pump subunit AcrA (membrane-fusion protein)